MRWLVLIFGFALAGLLFGFSTIGGTVAAGVVYLLFLAMKRIGETPGEDEAPRLGAGSTLTALNLSNSQPPKDEARDGKREGIAAENWGGPL